MRGETHTRVTEFGGRSHGESVMELTSRLIPDALYLLDEPESGLSPVAQMALVAQLHALGEAGAQVIAVTHSPVLLAVPDARIVSVPTLEPVLFRDCEPVTATQEFVRDPAGTARFLVEP